MVVEEGHPLLNKPCYILLNFTDLSGTCPCQGRWQKYRQDLKQFEYWKTEHVIRNDKRMVFTFFYS